MKKDDLRDASIDTFLRTSRREGQAVPQRAGGCVETETLAAWSEGALSTSEAAAVEAHLAGCAACQQVLGVFAQTSPPPAESHSLWQRWHLRWGVPLAAAATAAAIWVAVPDRRKEPIQDAFTAADSTPRATPGEPDLPVAKSEPPAPAPAAAGERESAARNDANSSLRAENREGRQEKEEADLQSVLRQPAAPASAPAAAAAPAERPLADAAASAAPAQQRQAAFATTEVLSPDPAVRWRVLPTGQIERSTNAGQTWEAVAFPQKATAIRALTATTAVATAADGRQFRTDDQGKTWNPLQP